MNLNPEVERASYLHLHINHAAAVPTTARTERPFVTISREAGAGGSSLAKLLAMRLNEAMPDAPSWSIYDGNLLESMLEASHLPPELARFLPEDRPSEIESMIGEIVGLHPNLWDLRRKTNDAMRHFARSGHVILVGRGSVFATRDLPGGLHVRLVAPFEARAQRMAALLRTDVDTAAARNLEQDRARQRYVRDVFGADVTDPLAYHLLINTGVTPLPEAGALIAQQVRARCFAPEVVAG